MTKGELLFNGNEKQVYATDDPHRVIFRYKDVAVAYNGVKRARFPGKGVLASKISGMLLGYLGSRGVQNHFVQTLGEREQLCRKIEIIPLEVVYHNRIAGTLASRLGVEDGFKPGNVVLDLCYNNDELGDPLVNSDQAVALGLAGSDEIRRMFTISRKAGKLLTALFSKAGLELVDAKFEFGRASDSGEIIISDELSPDTCRIWDAATGERLDKDCFRLDLGELTGAYAKVLERLQTLNL